MGLQSFSQNLDEIRLIQKEKLFDFLKKFWYNKFTK
jgi:hypothetical protein